MYVKIYPGPENKALIDTLKDAISVYRKSDDEQIQREKMEEIIYDLAEQYSNDELMDALYYACKDGKRMLELQEEYFQTALNTDEFEYYVDRFFNELGHSW